MTLSLQFSFCIIFSQCVPCSCLPHAARKLTTFLVSLRSVLPLLPFLAIVCVCVAGGCSIRRRFTYARTTNRWKNAYHLNLSFCHHFQLETAIARVVPNRFASEPTRSAIERLHQMASNDVLQIEGNKFIYILNQFV